jgi:hypothetical protein
MLTKVNGDRDATDDVQLVERAGGKVVIVAGPATNFKVTTPEDLARAEKLLQKVVRAPRAPERGHQASSIKHQGIHDGRSTPRARSLTGYKLLLSYRCARTPASA